jgi:DNA-binding MarR family transcriptional regulator
MDADRKPPRRSLPVLNDDPREWELKVIVAFFKCNSLLERRLADDLAAHGLTLAQFDVLMTLRHTDGITQQELAEWLLVTKANVVGLIDRVSAANWVERRQDPEDRRVNRLYLTPAGRKIVAKANPGQFALVKKLFGRLTEAELRQMHALLGRLQQACSEDG